MSGTVKTGCGRNRNEEQKRDWTRNTVEEEREVTERVAEKGDWTRNRRRVREESMDSSNS